MDKARNVESILTIALMFSHASGNQHFHVNRSKFAPVNNRSALTMCQYGNLPGSWILPRNYTQVHEFSMLSYPSKGGQSPDWFDVGQLPFETDYRSAPFGSRYQLFDPNCQLDNLIEPFLNPKAPVPST